MKLGLHVYQRYFLVCVNHVRLWPYLWPFGGPEKAEICNNSGFGPFSQHSVQDKSKLMFSSILQKVSIGFTSGCFKVHWNHGPG